MASPPYQTGLLKLERFYMKMVSFVMQIDASSWIKQYITRQICLQIEFLEAEFSIQVL